MNFAIYLTENKAIPTYISSFIPLAHHRLLCLFALPFTVVLNSFKSIFTSALERTFARVFTDTMITNLISYNFMSLEKINVAG